MLISATPLLPSGPFSGTRGGVAGRGTEPAAAKSVPASGVSVKHPGRVARRACTCHATVALQTDEG